MKKYIIDIDGTILDGNLEINNSVEFIKHLQLDNVDFLLTTNSIKSPEIQCNRLKTIGIEILPMQIYSPINSINNYLEKNKFFTGFIVGSELEKRQLNIIHNQDNPEILILLDFEKENYDYIGIQKLIDLVENGCPVITASKSPFYYVHGKKRVDTGSFTTIIENVTGINIEVLGKPSPNYYKGAINRLSAKHNNTFVIGDDWQTDIKGGNEAGCKTIFIRSGKYLKGDEVKCEPFKVINNLMELI